MMEADEPVDSAVGQRMNGKDFGFLSGVVEGFYGRPWTPEQRKDLFIKMGKWGMNAYLYAPKDDYKHRAYWREQYSVDEAEHLRALIAAAKEHNILFLYAISPGLDITYSSSKEITTLKRKLDQVAEFGCEAFALLFDDIIPEMSDADKEVFQSFAHAQVSVTNEVYEHLGRPRFMFCPTQYSASRASPDVPTSEYLHTVGAKLTKDIDIMWTGPRVVSRVISEESLEELHQVFRRYPVIWDNIHANDYDPKRVFLGPYCGRSPAVLRRLRGVLTNPNCEYECNFIGIHTLAQWTRCSEEAKDECSESRFEAEDDDEEHDYANLPPHVYHPRRALKLAIRDWTAEFGLLKMSTGVVVAPPGTVAIGFPISVPMALSAGGMSASPVSTESQVVVPVPIPVPMPAPIASSVHLPTSVTLPAGAFPGGTSDRWPTPLMQNVALPPVSQPLPMAGQPTPVQVDMVQASIVNTVVTVPMMNSLASSDKVLIAPLPPPPSLLPVVVPSQSPLPLLDGVLEMKDEEMMDIHHPGSADRADTMDDKQALDPSGPPLLDESELQLVADSFYLPHEHGPGGLRILAGFNWLKMNAKLAVEARQLEALKKRVDVSPETLAQVRPEVQEWLDKALNFGQMCVEMDRLLSKLRSSPNKSLVYSLYPYVWDLRGILSLLNTYIMWLGAVPLPENYSNYVTGVHTWFAKGWKEAFMGGDQEPWVFRGGLPGDLQRLLPVDSPNELFVYTTPEIPGAKLYTIRPYRHGDEKSVYDICRLTCNDGGEIPEVFKEFPDLIPEKFVGGFLAFCPEYAFVAESEDGDIVGFIVGTTDYDTLRKKTAIAWTPELRNKYPRKIPQELCDRYHASASATPHAASPTPVERMPVDGEDEVSSVAMEARTASSMASIAIEEDLMLAPLEETLESLHTDDMCCLPEVPRPILVSHPCTIRVGLLSAVSDPALSKKLAISVMAALRSNGVFGAFTELTREDVRLRDFYTKLGFQEIRGLDCSPNRVLLGRNF